MGQHPAIGQHPQGGSRRGEEFAASRAAGRSRRVGMYQKSPHQKDVLQCVSRKIHHTCCLKQPLCLPTKCMNEPIFRFNQPHFVDRIQSSTHFCLHPTRFCHANALMKAFFGSTASRSINPVIHQILASTNPFPSIETTRKPISFLYQLETCQQNEECPTKRRPRGGRNAPAQASVTLRVVLPKVNLNDSKKEEVFLLPLRGNFE